MTRLTREQSEARANARIQARLIIKLSECRRSAEKDYPASGLSGSYRVVCHFDGKESVAVASSRHFAHSQNDSEIANWAKIDVGESCPLSPSIGTFCHEFTLSWFYPRNCGFPLATFHNVRWIRPSASNNVQSRWQPNLFPHFPISSSKWRCAPHVRPAASICNG